jgi:hypothetical protein
VSGKGGPGLPLFWDLDGKSPPVVVSDATLGVTPELVERLSRISKKTGRTVTVELNIAVQEYWVRFACREHLKQGEW